MSQLDEGARMPISKSEFRRRLRSDPTDAEHLLWYELRNRALNGYKFVRQFSIGPYFVDFVCRRKKLIVELDGSQHNDNAYDMRRDAWLNTQGYSVLRFWNAEVLKERKEVLATILAVLEGRIEHGSEGLRLSLAALPKHVR
jgi:very-short-patch-repair endonuclease